ncbi:MAG: VWA domain-containing protein [Acidobacteriota bacterium]
MIFLLAASLAAQESQFGVRSRLVLVPVNVTDARGRPVDSLEAADFLVSDNGRPQKVAIDTIGTGVAPVALVIAVQAAGISEPVLEKVRKIGGMIQPLVTGERGCAAVAAFAESVSWLQDECTKDPDAIATAFERLRPGEHAEAHMLDAVDAAVVRLRRRQNARRVLLLISESRDRGSATSLDAATESAQSAGVAIYAATYSAFKTAFTSKSPQSQQPRPARPRRPNETIGTVNGAPPGPQNPSAPPPEQQVDILGGIRELSRLGKKNTAQVLAQSTGGATFSFNRQKTLEETIGKFGEALHTQYVLSFVPEPESSGFHKLEVRIARSGKYQVRARPGYWSTAD